MRNLIWLRVFFLLVVVQALSIGRSLIWPDLIAANLPWPASPLNARFVATLYWMGATSALLGVFAQRYAEMRIAIIEIGVVTGGLLLLTVPHFGEFTAERFPYRWTILYTIDPLVAGLILWLMRGHDAVPPGYNQFAPLFGAYAGVLGLVGLVLLIVPEFAGQIWPWALPPILAQVYSIFFLTFALGGALAAREPRWEGVWIYVVANMIMLALIIGVSIYHADRFKATSTTRIWYGLCTAGALAFAAALLLRPRRLFARRIFQ